MNKSNKTLPIIIGLVVLVAAGAVLYLFVLRPSDSGEVYTNYSPGDYFVTNVKGSNRLFKADVVLVLNSDSEKLIAELNGMSPQIRDTIIFCLRNMAEEDIKDPDKPNELRELIRDSLNESLTFSSDEFSNVVHSVLFNEFVMQ